MCLPGGHSGWKVGSRQRGLCSHTDQSSNPGNSRTCRVIPSITEPLWAWASSSIEWGGEFRVLMTIKRADVCNGLVQAWHTGGGDH